MRTEIGQRLMDMLSKVTWGDGQPRGFVYTSERLQDWDQAPAQPALYVTEGDENYKQPGGVMPPIRDIEFRVVVYHDVGKDTSHPRPATENDMILEAFEKVMLNFDTPDQRQTLGGLVHHARIEGTIMKDSGDLDGQAMLLVPIWVMIP